MKKIYTLFLLAAMLLPFTARATAVTCSNDSIINEPATVAIDVETESTIQVADTESRALMPLIRYRDKRLPSTLPKRKAS